MSWIKKCLSNELTIAVSHRWRSIKSKPGPGCLNSHCAVKFLSVMMLFGGEREGQTLNDMWRFHFGKEGTHTKQTLGIYLLLTSHFGLNVLLVGKKKEFKGYIGES